MSVILGMFNEQSDGKRYQAGETIFREGDPGQEMYVVLQGEVELTISPGLVELLGPGEPFGEMALIDSASRVATATARTACRLVAIPEDRFLNLIQDKPYFALEIMKAMAHRLRKMDARAGTA